MALGNIKENAENLPTEIHDLLNSQLEYYKLYVFRMLAKMATGVASLFIMSLFGLVIAFFLAVAMAFALGEWVGSTGLGFLIVSVIFALLALLIYYKREQIIYKSLLEKLSEIYFSKD